MGQPGLRVGPLLLSNSQSPEGRGAPVLGTHDTCAALAENECSVHSYEYCPESFTNTRGMSGMCQALVLILGRQRYEVILNKVSTQGESLEGRERPGPSSPESRF